VADAILPDAQNGSGSGAFGNDPPKAIATAKADGGGRDDRASRPDDHGVSRVLKGIKEEYAHVARIIAAIALILLLWRVVAPLFALSYARLSSVNPPNLAANWSPFAPSDAEVWSRVWTDGIGLVMLLGVVIAMLWAIVALLRRDQIL
jgi:hypothetical protein